MDTVLKLHRVSSRALIRARAVRKRRAGRTGNVRAWSGLGMMGLIGWSVVLPTLGGAALGLWLDAWALPVLPWTLVWLLAGLSLGCVQAWHRIRKEGEEMEREEQDD